VILMRRGEVAASGKPRDIISLYQQQIEPSRINTMKAAMEDDRAVIESLAFYTPSGLRPSAFHTGDPLVARIDYVAHHEIRDAVFEIFVRTGDLTEMCQLTTETSGSPINLPEGPGTLEFQCDELSLQPGMYHANVCVKERLASEAINWQYHAATLRVDPGRITRGQFYQSNRWKLLRAPSGTSTQNGAGEAERPPSIRRPSLTPTT
jgi:hypothetical protein